MLTPEQRAAVEWSDGPLMVLAGAGTGKTTVVVERVRHLLATDTMLEPENVLVLTYNVRAAAELTERLEASLGVETASRLWVHNFHSFGNGVLAEHRADLGLVSDADVLDGVGQRLLLRELRPRFGHFLYHWIAINSGWTFSRFADLISRAKDELVSPEEYTAFARAKREAFDFSFGTNAFEEAVEEIRSRNVEGRLWGVRRIRSALRDGPEATDRVARLEARREVSGVASYPPAWTQLTDEQRHLASGLTERFIRDAEACEVLRLTEEAEAYAIYQEELRARGLLDFGEQMLRTIQLLTERPNLLRRYQSQFRHVLVDEFQDANMAQILLLELLGRGPDKPDNVVVVGDDDQSIYRFRGASYAAFERFRERFERPPAWAPDRPAQRVERLPLLENRRSSANILASAGRLIVENAGRLKSEPLQPTKPGGDPVEIVVCSDEADEADVVVARIRRLFEGLPELLPGPAGIGRPKRWSDIAVLYRKHRHRELIVDRLRKQEIPYVAVGGTGLFTVPEVRDVEAALRVCADPEESVSFVRLLSAGPWRLDATEILRLTRAADWDGRPVYEAALDVLREGTLPADPLTASGSLGDGIDQEDMAGGDGATNAVLTLWAEADLPADAAAQSETLRERRSREGRSRIRRQRLDARLRVKLERLLGTLEAILPRARRDGPFAVLEDYLVRTNLLHDLIAVGTPDAQRTVLALARLMRFTADWQRAHPRESLADFVAYLDVYQGVGGDIEPDLPGRVEVEGVQLMTVYQAKGLEYEAVIVPRLVEREFPDTREETQLIPVELLKQAPPAEFAIAEERRLAFVAMTRARRHLLLTAIDGSNGKGVSRFLGPIANLGATEPGIGEAPPPPGVAVERRTPAPDADVETLDRPNARAPGGQSSGGQAPDGRASGAQSSGGQASGGQAPDGRASGAQSSGGQASSARAADGRASRAQSWGARAADQTAALLKLMPVPDAHHRRFSLRRRAVELIGALEALGADDHEARTALTAELVTVAEDAAGQAQGARREGLDPLSLTVLSRHAPAGRTLLELAPLPQTFSHSQFEAYRACPLRYAFDKVYRIPVGGTRGPLEFGSSVHQAFETFVRARRDARAAGAPEPGYEELRAAFESVWVPTNYGDRHAADHYATKAEPALRRFFEREVASVSEAVAVEVPFAFALEPGDGSAPVRFFGEIDRIDRLPDGSIELTDYKTGRPRTQAKVDEDTQLSLYALALAVGAVRDPSTGAVLPAASRLTLYFTEIDQALSTTRSPEQLADFSLELLEVARRIRDGDFAATPSPRTCDWCDFRLLCPSRWGSATNA